jgi:uncharacterized protein with HEPN domain
LRRDRLFLLDVVEACDKIERYLGGKSFDEFSEDEIVFDATVRNLQNIGEAVRCLPEETRALRPDIEWKRIVGLRHLLVHQYFGVDEEIVWNLATDRCPELMKAAKDMLQRLPE